MQDAGARKEHAEVLRDFGDRRDGGLGGAPRDALLDGHGRRESGQGVDVRLRQLFDELAGVGGDAFQEATLAFGEEDVEGERGLPRPRDARHHRQRAMRDLQRDVAEVVLAGAAQRDAGRARPGLMRARGGEGRIASRQEVAGRGPGLGDLRGRALRDEQAAAGAGFGAHLQNPIAGLEDVEVVLDDDERMAGVREAM